MKLNSRVICSSPEGGSDFLCILFYPADFTQLVREEVIEAAHRIDEFRRAKCQVTVDTDYSHAVTNTYVEPLTTGNNEVG